MQTKRNLILRLALAGSAALALAQTATAQTFQHYVGDLMLTFRKTGIYQENNEVVVDLGQASNYVNAAIGATLPVAQVSGSQLTPGCFTSLNDLSWAVTGDYQGTTYPGYPNYTLWVSVPRTDNSTQSATPYRLAFADQSNVRTKIESIFGGATFVSSNLGTSNQFNTPSLVRESIATYGTHIVSVWMGSIVDNTIGTLNDTWPNTEPNSGNLELTTPPSFSGSVRADLYEVRPMANAQGVPIVDPHTGTSGAAYYVGYFELSSTGTLTFTRQAASAPLPPAPQIVSIKSSGGTATISFTTTNGPTYTLYYTNAAGLSAPVSSWTSSPTTAIGNGGTMSLSDTSADPLRVYRVGVH